MPSPELIARAERGEIALGGCRLEPDQPEWICRECEALEEDESGAPP